MAQDAPIQKVTVTVAGREIVLDPANMKYNENSLQDYMGKEYGWVDYLGKQLEYAQKEALLADIEADRVYGIKFMESKDRGESDNYAKAFANSHVEVVAAKQHLADRKEVVGHLKAHLKAWDKNHENVQNRGHTLRKELDKLHNVHYTDDATVSFEDAIAATKEQKCP
jgi:hypothetical protein